MSNTNAGGSKTKSGKKFESIIWKKIKNVLSDDARRIVLDDSSGLRWLMSDSAFASSNRGTLHVDGKLRGFICCQDDLYNFLAENSPDMAKTKAETSQRKKQVKNRISKVLNPDFAFFDFQRNNLLILEIKAQSSEGSVDEKLETVDFKRKQYLKLVKGTQFKSVEFKWILDNKFRAPKYDDVKTYIREMDSDYLIDDVTLEFLGIP